MRSRQQSNAQGFVFPWLTLNRYFYGKKSRKNFAKTFKMKYVQDIKASLRTGKFLLGFLLPTRGNKP